MPAPNQNWAAPVGFIRAIAFAGRLVTTGPGHILRCALLESDPAGGEKVLVCMEKLVENSERILELIAKNPLIAGTVETEIMSMLNELKSVTAGESPCGA